jgi:hypothetical protein
LKLEPKVKSSIQEAIESLITKIEKSEISHPTTDIPEYNNPHLLEISLYDHHFGMLATREETGNIYNLEEAKFLYVEAIKKLLSKIKGYNIDKIVLPIGQDFFHINDITNNTPKSSNNLDVDGTLPKIFEYGFESVINAVSLCRKIAPVSIQ